MSASPIVVGGCYRSGTSLVRRMLDSHPRIHCGPEVKFFRDFYGDYLIDPVRHIRFMETARTLLPEPELLEVLGGAFVELHERAAAAAGKPRWADKVPENLAFLDAWGTLLGDDWTLLHVARNPLDTLASIAEAKFPVSIPPALEDRIDLYVRYNEAGLAFERAHPARYVRVVYEDLVGDPRTTAGAMMDALGEQLDPIQLAVNAAPHEPGLEDPSVASTTEISASSVGRWRGVLGDAEAETIRARTRELWARLDPAERWPA